MKRALTFRIFLMNKARQVFDVNFGGSILRYCSWPLPFGITTVKRFWCCRAMRDRWGVNVSDKASIVTTILAPKNRGRRKVISRQSRKSPISETKIKQFEDLSMVPKLEVVHPRHCNLQRGLGEILSQMDSSEKKSTRVACGISLRVYIP